MLGMHTGASQFNHLGAQRLEDFKLELLRAVITQMRLCVKAGLQSVCANTTVRVLNGVIA